MQKYLEYFSFLQWPTGQLEKDFNLLENFIFPLRIPEWSMSRAWDGGGNSS